MKIIEKIEIKYFRSFSDSPTVIMNLKDINIFSGGNDSGKSNVLRTLNLFFNNEIDHGTKFRFDRDFSIFRKNEIEKSYQEKKVEFETINSQSNQNFENIVNEVYGDLDEGQRNDDENEEDISNEGDSNDEEFNEPTNKKEQKGIKKTSPFVEIKVFFNLGNDHKQSLPKQFRISKRRTRTKFEVIDSNIETEYKRIHKDEEKNLIAKGEKKTRTNRLNGLKRTQTLFLKSIEFFYVPAIKDVYFFRTLYNKLQGKLAQEANKKLQSSIGSLQTTIQNETKQLFDKFKESTGIDASFLLGGELLDFRKNVEVITDESIYLTSRGDGIQARLIPDILAELSNNSSSKYIIRGFEEPENSYEYKNSIKLANEFYDKYSNTIQLFLTTHAKEFLAMRDKNIEDNKVSIYRIYKETTGESNVGYYNEKKGIFVDKSNKNIGDIDGLNDDLGIIDQSRLIADLEKKVTELPWKENRIKELEVQLIETIEELKKKQLNEDTLREELDLASIQNNKIVYCEGNNEIIFNSLGFDGITFIGNELNKEKVFEAVKKKGIQLPFGLIDKDFLYKSESIILEERTNLLVLNFYSIENYLYHPDNLEEFFGSKGIQFNKNRYKQKIVNLSKRKKNKADIYRAREKYGAIKPFLGVEFNHDAESIIQDNNSDVFEIFYNETAMKEIKGDLTELNNIQDMDLGKTNWFKQNIESKLNF